MQMWNSLLENMTETIRDTFGQAVIYHRLKDDTKFEITAVFDITYAQSDAGGTIPTSIPQKELDVCLIDIGNLPPAPEDEVIINDKKYRVKDVKPTTSGMFKLILRDTNARQ